MKLYKQRKTTKYCDVGIFSSEELLFLALKKQVLLTMLNGMFLYDWNNYGFTNFIKLIDEFLEVDSLDAMRKYFSERAVSVKSINHNLGKFAEEPNLLRCEVLELDHAMHHQTVEKLRYRYNTFFSDEQIEMIPTSPLCPSGEAGKAQVKILNLKKRWIKTYETND